jgi:hypothetical protein
MAYADELGYQVFRLPIARFLCRRWNAQHPPPRQVAEFDFIYSMETTPSIGPGLTRKSIARERLATLDLTDSGEKPLPIEGTPYAGPARPVGFTR